MPITVDGTVAIVTGGGRGIGRAVAQRLVAGGATVVIGDLDGDVAEHAARELGGRAVPATLDVADPESFADVVGLARQYGRIGVLINNAGIMRTGRFADQDLAGMHREVHVNLLGAMTGMHLVLPEMLDARAGHIANVASMAGRMTTPGASVYSASKFGVAALSRTVRAELAGSGVSVSTILPAAVKTELTAGLGTAGMPRSSPETVAEAIVRTCEHPRAEVCIPRWVGPIGSVVEALPQWLGDGAKRLAGSERRLASGTPEAQAYQERVNQVSAGPRA